MVTHGDDSSTHRGAWFALGVFVIIFIAAYNVIIGPMAGDSTPVAALIAFVFSIAAAAATYAFLRVRYGRYRQR
jgi:hypothetical protein